MSILSGDPRSLSYEAYIYLYPLVIMEVTRRQAINFEAGAKPAFGPPNEFHSLRAFPPADLHIVVRPNFDTLYSSAFLDLTAGPVVVHAPDTHDRFYMLPMIDMWTDVFASPGKRTTGTGSQDFVVVGPGYGGELPEGKYVIKAPTPWVWVIGRTQCNGPDDYAAVHAIQDGYTITPLHPTAHAIDPHLDTTTVPPQVVNGMSATDFFTYACDAMLANPPHPTDFSILARIANLGIVPGKPFALPALGADGLSEVEAGVAAARKAIVGLSSHLGTQVNGWSISTETVGVYGNAYLQRATWTLVGLAANPPEDAVYPLLLTDSDGEPTTGEQDYVLHFDAGKLPPAAAFWSVTMYDSEGYVVPNELNRFELGSRESLTHNADGSVDIFIQHTAPDSARQANWLPAPTGPFGITMRLYAPSPEVLNGTWAPPPVTKA